MLWYFTFIAGLNLALGYLWAAHLRPCPRCAKIRELGAVIAGASAPFSEPEKPSVPRVQVAPEAQPIQPVVQEAVPEPAVVEAPVAPTEPNFDDLEPLISEASETVPRDPATGLATREHAEQLLERLAISQGDKDPVTVALVEVDQIDWSGGETNEAIDERVLCGVSIIARESLASTHTAARFARQQLLLVLAHDDVHQATRRTEELRQRVATTEFLADGRAVNTSVTCALTEVSQKRSGKILLEFLQEALGEAKRYGGNRTFMHDGNAPSPVVPPELELAPQQLAI